MDRFGRDMNHALKTLATHGTPRKSKALKKANVSADNIIKLLQAERKFDIAHVCISGSTGKKTTIISSDVDCVLFINGKTPPFEVLLKEFAKILTDKSKSYNITDVRPRQYSLQLKVDKLDFDILPATNFVQGLQQGGDNLIDIQEQQVLEQIKQDPEQYGYEYSSSLAHSTVRFMRKQSAFAHEMVRIAKFWYKTLHLGVYVSGAKMCIELIAVYTANEDDNMSDKPYLRSFKRFIDYVINFDSLNIHFEKDEQKVLYKSLPRVMDPVNPYNNLAKNWEPKAIQLVKQFAIETSRRLLILEKSNKACFDELFEPQPEHNPEMREIFYSIKSQWLVETKGFSLLPDLIIRKDYFRADSKRHCLKILQNYFQCMVLSSKISGFNVEQTKFIVQNAISKYIDNSNCSCDSYKLKDYDVTFVVPFSNRKAVRISFRL